jgi:hypothetical protein
VYARVLCAGVAFPADSSKSSAWLAKSLCYASPSAPWLFTSTHITIGTGYHPEQQSIGSSSKNQQSDCRSFATASGSKPIETDWVGLGAFHRWKNWTVGCIALTDEEIEELSRVTPDGTTIEIRP